MKDLTEKLYEFKSDADPLSNGLFEFTQDKSFNTDLSADIQELLTKAAACALEADIFISKAILELRRGDDE